MNLKSAKAAAILAAATVLTIGSLWSSGRQRSADNQKKTPPQNWDKHLGPLVPHKTFPADCGLCHLPKTWSALRPDFSFDHEKQTGYRLEGAHQDALCIRCHNDRGPVKVYVARGCVGCHVDPHNATLGITCVRCHDQNSWRVSNMGVQHASTRFPLSGAHANISCDRCHAKADSGNFKGSPTDCFSCHRDDFQRGPNHVSMAFSHACDSCHQTTSFANASFNHALVPGGGAGRCFTCHGADFQRAPNHVTMAFSHSCDSCHQTSSWTGATFNHALLPGGGAGQCYTCHSANFQQAPNHVALTFSHSCDSCHQTTQWTGATFNHSLIAGGGAGQCWTCHQADYQRGPNHVALSFPHSCDTCHTTTRWTQ